MRDLQIPYNINMSTHCMGYMYAWDVCMYEAVKSNAIEIIPQQ